MLHNHSQWHIERAPNPSKKVNSIEEIDSTGSKLDVIFAYISKQNTDNIPLEELVTNTNENIDVNYIRLFGSNGYVINYNNSYGRPPYAPNNYGRSVGSRLIQA